MPGKNCSTCKFALLEDANYHCRVNGPRTVTLRGKTFQEYPIVTPQHWCHKWRPHLERGVVREHRG